MYVFSHILQLIHAEKEDETKLLKIATVTTVTLPRIDRVINYNLGRQIGNLLQLAALSSCHEYRDKFRCKLRDKSGD